MKTIALSIALLAASYNSKAQNPSFNEQFRGFQIFFERIPVPGEAGQISVLYPACRVPYSQNYPEFPTETQITGQLITVTYAFWIPNTPSCLSGRVERYLLPVLQQGSYQLKVNARFVSPAVSGVPARIVETRTLAQINFVSEVQLVTQVPNLTPVGFVLLSLMMLGVGAYLTGRRAA